VERLLAQTVIRSGETMTIDMLDGYGPREISSGDIVQLRNPDGPEAADTIEELVEALKLQEAAELANTNCIECEGEGDWTHCSLCSSRFGNAIDVRYALLAKLEAGEDAK
jgi:hypothetical protein